MNQDQIKQQVALKAIEFVLPHLDGSTVLGIGTGSTANYFIDYLAEHRDKIAGTIASSTASEQRLVTHNIPVLDLNQVEKIPFYIDGADECNPKLELIKGGGGALTREKIVAQAADTFICIADGSKWVETLGAFPLPVEIIPMAQQLVSQRLENLGGKPYPRKNYTTDNGNIILDVHGLKLDEAIEMESTINNIPGVLCNGIFALRPADMLLLGNECGVDIIDH